MSAIKKYKFRWLYIITSWLIPLLSMISITTIVSCSVSEEIQNKPPQKLGEEQEKFERPNSLKTPIESTANPADVIPELGKINTYNEFLNVNSNLLKLDEATSVEINKINTRINTPSLKKEIKFGDFRKHSPERYKEINSIINEIKKNAIKENLSLSSGYDFILKDNFTIRSVVQDTGENKHILSVLAQLTKDGKEIFGADFYIDLNDYHVSDVSSPINKPENQTSWKELINNAINFSKSQIPNESLSEKNFSSFEWKIRQLLGIKDNEFLLYFGEYMNISSDKPDLSSYLEKYALSFEIDRDNNKLNLTTKSYDMTLGAFYTLFNKEKANELIDLLKDIANEVIDIASDSAKPEWWYVNFLKLAQTKNKLLFEKIDKLINLLMSLDGRISKSIYQFKPNEIKELDKSLIDSNKLTSITYKKSEWEQLLNLDVAKMWDFENNKWKNDQAKKLVNYFVSGHYPVVDSNNIAMLVDKTDLQNNKISFYALDSNVHMIYNSYNLGLIKMLSQQNYVDQELKFSDALDFSRDIYSNSSQLLDFGYIASNSNVINKPTVVEANLI